MQRSDLAIDARGAGGGALTGACPVRQAVSFGFGRSAPHAVSLGAQKSMLQAFVDDGAPGAELLGVALLTAPHRLRLIHLVVEQAVLTAARGIGHP